MPKEKPRNRKTTILDRAVLRFQKTERPKTFTAIYEETFPVIRNLAVIYSRFFPGKSADDLIQEGFLHVRYKLIPIYDAKKAGFKTLVTISIKQKFQRMLAELKAEKRGLQNLPTYTEYEFRFNADISDVPDSRNFMADVLASDFLKLFEERLTEESWDIYKRLYRNPKLNLRKLAKKKKLSMASLYRKCQKIYEFLSILMERTDDE